MSAFPNWVYEVVGQLAEQQDTHPVLLFKDSIEGTRQWNWCPCMALKLVPKEIVEEAVRTREERRKAEEERFRVNLGDVMVNIQNELYSLGLPEPVVNDIVRNAKIEANKTREVKRH